MRRKVMSALEQPHVPLAIAGLGLVLTTSVVGSGFSPLALPFAFWAAMPYGEAIDVQGRPRPP